MKYRTLTILAVLMLGLTIAPACVQAQATTSRQKFHLKPVQDTFSYVGAEGLANHGKYPYIEVGYGFAGFIRFDLSAIPPGFKFVKAKLRLTQTASGPFEFAKTARLYSPAFAWDENYKVGPSGNGGIHFYDAGETAVTVSQGTYSRAFVYSGSSLVELCNDWHAPQQGSIPNNGFLLLPGSVGSPDDALVLFDSSEGYTAPELILTGEITVTP